ncbi:MAG: class I SAM-dependent methyltransferase [Acidobacteriota bacterium]|nr:MAG: class I SAM-dependent methyltransferase [Acidobacteriota bacterium]
MPEDIYTDYDRFAWFYNKYWGGEFSRPALAILNIILLPHLSERARILDLCCGTGQITAGLAAKGYHLTGLDGSAVMLEFARQNAPGVEFIQGDARSFHLDDKFDAVISPFDSLNHIMTVAELKSVFGNVSETLTDEGIFLFDLNLEDESEAQGNSINMIEEDNACIVNASYDPVEKLKRYDVTMFRLESGCWRRTDVSLFQRYFEIEEIMCTLSECGFRSVRTYDARKEFGFTLSDGRIFYVARK